MSEFPRTPQSKEAPSSIIVVVTRLIQGQFPDAVRHNFAIAVTLRDYHLVELTADDFLGFNEISTNFDNPLHRIHLVDSENFVLGERLVINETVVVPETLDEIETRSVRSLFHRGKNLKRIKARLRHRD